MKPERWFCLSRLWPIVFPLLAQEPESFGQAPRLDSLQLTNGVVGFNVIGTTNAYYRVDSSTDALNWLPIDAYQANGLPHSVRDSLAPGSGARFYRAVNTDPDLGVLELSPASGPPGTQVVVVGQFFPAPSQLTVTFGNVGAPVISGTSTRLLVQVPTDAVTSQVTVRTGTESQTSRGAFVVQANAVVTFTPPAGISAQDFEINNNYGPGVALASPPGAWSIPVRVGSPTLTYATPNDTNLSIFFCAVSVDPSQPISITAASTAEALVFQDGHLMVQDPDLARAVLAVIHTNTDVQAFARVLAQTMVQTQLVWSDPGVNTAYQTAVASVINGSAIQAMTLTALASPPSANRAPRISTSGVQIYQLEFPATRFLDINAKGLKIETVVEDFFYNPVDWLVMYQKVDVDKAFPNGRRDFDLVQHSFETTPRVYPLDEGFEVERSVKANLVSSRLDVVGTLARTIYSALIPKFTDESVTLPSEDAMYLVRGVGPALVTPEDVAFVEGDLASVRGRIIGLNLMSAALDVLSLVVEDKELEEIQEKAKDLTDLAQEAATEGPGIQTEEDFERAVYVLADGLIKEVVQQQLKNAVGAAVKFVGENAASINQKLKNASVVGKLAERAAGLFRTTALETSFVLVGDPFQLQIIKVQPRIGSPGQDITVEFKGSPEWRPFDTNNALDNVTLEGSSGSFYGQVKSVQGPDELGIQTLTVQIPASLGNSADGPYTLYVNTQGRRGSTPFTVSTSAALARVTPAQGFAAAPNFLGNPFPGTRVHLEGALFTVTDTFLFAGGTSGAVEATNKSTGLSSSGDVYVYVPAGAASGPVQILHQLTNGTSLQITGPVFTVLGPPKIQSIQPSSAPPGLTLNLSVSNIGLDASMVYVQFTGQQPETVSLLPNAAVTVIVPSQAQSGPLAIITPAGTDQVPFTVLPPLTITVQPGAGITVGGASPISLNRAIALAHGDATPVDGPDDSTDANPDPPEEGDYVVPDNGPLATPRWALGPLYKNSILIDGTNTDNADFVLNYDSLNGGGLAGNITISGHNNRIGPLTFQGPVTVSGYSNFFINVAFLGPATFTGSNNVLDQCTAQAPMTVLGENNQFTWVNFQGVAGNALTIKGNRNVLADGINVYSNSGDGIVIDGGKYNQVVVNSVKGGGGNAVTLTGGAEGNALTSLRDLDAKRGTASAGHGLALIGSAVGNQVSGQFVGYGLDGIYLDGPGVTQNRFPSIYVGANGRNGITITNGAQFNQIGDPDFQRPAYVYVDQNAGSGVALLGCGENGVSVWARTNGLYGVLVSGVQVQPGGLQIVMTTSGSGLSNGKAALRLEQGTTGVHALLNTYGKDLVGVELDGADVTGNLIEGIVANTLSNGVVIRGAHNNELAIGAGNTGADGLLLQGASNNVIRLLSTSNNASNGVHVTFGSYGNRFTSQLGFGAGSLSNLNGVVFDTDSHDNVMEFMYVQNNRQDGLVFSGARRNEYVWSGVREAGRDGIRFENGAQDNIVGSDAVDVPGHITYEINVQGCGAAGVHMTGSQTQGNIVRRSLISADFLAGQPIGVLVDSGCGGGLLTGCTISQNNDGVVVRDGASNVALVNLTLLLNTNSAISITNASAVRIGGSADADHNEIFLNPTGVDISGPGSVNNVLLNNHIVAGMDAVYLHDGAQSNEVAGANVLENSLHGVRIEAAYGNLVRGSVIQGNQSAGILVARGATNNSVEANTIINNAVGVLVTDNDSLGNSILGNSITRNTGKGIQLSNGGNTGIAAPVLLDYSGVTVGGAAAAPDDSRVEIFSDSGNEGATWLGAGLVQSGHFHVPVQPIPTNGPPSFRLNGTVTDPEGNTSEFSGSYEPGTPATRLAFASSATGNREVYLWSGTGDALNLTQNPADDYSPALGSFSGCNQVLFVSTRTGKQDIFVMPAQPGAPARLVVTNTANNSDPAWLIQCRSLVFRSDLSGTSQIYSINLDGTGLMRLTTNSFSDYAPNATLDGRKIVFMSNRSGTNEIYVMNADGSNQQQVSNLVGAGNQPAFSPFGNSIAFTRSSGTKSEIWTITPDGQSLVQVTFDGASAAHPAWLLDGQHLVFSSNKTGAVSLYTISLPNGPTQALLINIFGDEPSVGPP